MGDRAIRYVGPEALHDAHVLSVERRGDTATVHIRAPAGETFAVEFSGVKALTAVHPEGMLLYGLAEVDVEVEVEGGARQFVFANWEEWDDAGLEIAARDFRVVPAGPPAHPGPA